MSDVTLLSCVILVTSALSGVHGYPTGAPVSKCADMTPEHGVAARPITPSIPYSVTMSKNTYYSGERHTVMVTGGNSQFKGLMLQARDANGQRVGTFSLSPGDISLKLLNCGGVAGTAVTHTGRNLKNSVTVTWTAPMMDMGSVTFRATVVEQTNTFYVGVLSQPATYMAMVQPPPMNNTNTMPTMAPVPPNDNTNGMNNDMNTYNGPGGSAVSLAGSLLVLFLGVAVFSFLRL